MHLRRFSFLILFLPFLFALPASADLSYRDQLIQKALDQKLDQDPYWSILLHYRPRWFGGVKSEIDAPEFFNAKDGRTNPRSELVETIRHFFDPPSKEQHPQCLFIDRYQWLKQKLSIDPERVPEQLCGEYQEWRKTLNPESITLIFSSFYMSNPSSSFGHTLLRLNQNHSSHLLDYGVNYAANPTTKNPLAYGIMGIVGGFDGVFSNIPYFVKVEEYNNIESRDLWEYELNFTSEEINRLMLHLWTVGHFPISYYFFDKNCSFMILTLLDAARPSLELSKEFNQIWVIPSDTVRGITSRPGLVKSIAARPSLAYRIQRQREGLMPEDDRLFLSLIHDGTPETRSRDLASIRALPGPRAAQVLDVTLDYLHFTKNGQADSLKSEVLLARSEISEPPPKIEFSEREIETERPDAGNDSARVSLGSGYDTIDHGYFTLGVRPAFHDLNADAMGYPRGSQIEALRLDAHYSPGFSRFRVDRADLINLVALTPWDPVFRKFSWTARLGADRVLDFNCSKCLEYKSMVGGGLSFEPAKPAIVYLLAEAEAGFGTDSVPGYRLGPAAEAGLVMTLSPKISLRAGGIYHHPVMGYTDPYAQGSAELRYSTSRDTDFRVGYDVFPLTSEERVIFNVYF